MGSCLLLPFQEIKVEEAEDAAGWELLSDGDDDMEGVIKRKGPQIAHKVAVSEAAGGPGRCCRPCNHSTAKQHAQKRGLWKPEGREQQGWGPDRAGVGARWRGHARLRDAESAGQAGATVPAMLGRTVG